jgi:hypothetical protein
MDATTRARTRSLITEALREVDDPELGVNVIDLGLIYSVLHKMGAPEGCSFHSNLLLTCEAYHPFIGCNHHCFMCKATHC